jgi:hypothetical protein
MKTPISLVVFVFATACVAPPLGSPREVATQIIQALDAGKSDQAAALYTRSSSDPNYREKIYPVVYEAATMRYTTQDNAKALPLLRFLVDNYDRSMAARQALIYSMFVARGEQAEAKPKSVEAMSEAVKDFLNRTKNPPIWIALVQTQQSIDLGKLDTARDHLARFHAGWDGRPTDLAVYVDDLQRYLNTH